jgi:hypothetical protein
MKSNKRDSSPLGQPVHLIPTAHRCALNAARWKWRGMALSSLTSQAEEIRAECFGAECNAPKQSAEIGPITPESGQIELDSQRRMWYKRRHRLSASFW